MVVIRNYNLTFPLNSSYLLETPTGGVTLNIYLPVINATTQMGAETVFIKNYAGQQSLIYDSTNAFIYNVTTAFTGGGTITLDSTQQYIRLIATRTSSGVYAWMCIGLG